MPRWYWHSEGSVATAAFACGDKLILSLGNLRFRQVNGSPRAASILAYTPQKLTGWRHCKGVGAAIRREAGRHSRSTSFDDRRQVGRSAEGSENTTSLLVDAVDADELERQAQSVPSKPVVVPVVHQSSKRRLPRRRRNSTAS